MQMKIQIKHQISTTHKNFNSSVKMKLYWQTKFKIKLHTKRKLQESQLSIRTHDNKICGHKQHPTDGSERHCPLAKRLL